jgi:hypothetical protein
MAAAAIAGIGTMWRGHYVSLAAGRPFDAVVARDMPIPAPRPAAPNPRESEVNGGR